MKRESVAKLWLGYYYKLVHGHVVKHIASEEIMLARTDWNWDGFKLSIILFLDVYIHTHIYILYSLIIFWIFGMKKNPIFSFRSLLEETNFSDGHSFLIQLFTFTCWFIEFWLAFIHYKNTNFICKTQFYCT